MYSIQNTESFIRIEPKDFAALTDALLKLAKDTHPVKFAKRGAKAERIKNDLNEALALFRFEAAYDASGALTSLVWNDYDYASDPEYMHPFLETLLPFVPDWSYLQFRCDADDGEFRYVFLWGEVREEYSKVVWDYEKMTPLHAIVEAGT